MLAKLYIICTGFWQDNCAVTMELSWYGLWLITYHFLLSQPSIYSPPVSIFTGFRSQFCCKSSSGNIYLNSISACDFKIMCQYQFPQGPCTIISKDSFMFYHRHIAPHVNITLISVWGNGIKVRNTGQTPKHNCDTVSHHFSFIYSLCIYYKVVQIWPGQIVTCLHTNSPGHIWTTLYFNTF
jgi:hypothetical protein